MLYAAAKTNKNLDLHTCGRMFDFAAPEWAVLSPDYEDNKHRIKTVQRIRSGPGL